MVSAVAVMAVLLIAGCNPLSTAKTGATYFTFHGPVPAWIEIDVTATSVSTTSTTFPGGAIGAVGSASGSADVASAAGDVSVYILVSSSHPDALSCVGDGPGGADVASPCSASADFVQTPTRVGMSGGVSMGYRRFVRVQPEDSVLVEAMSAAFTVRAVDDAGHLTGDFYAGVPPAPS